MPSEKLNPVQWLRESAITAAEQAEPAPAARSGVVKAEDLAVMFHDTYEELAPQFGYETRSDTKTFDPNSPNGQLMVAVCQRILAALETAENERPRAERVWQPIETAPKDGTQILTFSPQGTVICEWLPAGYFREGDPARWFPIASPTHWQPLPEPPVEHSKSEEQGT